MCYIYKCVLYYNVDMNVQCGGGSRGCAYELWVKGLAAGKGNTTGFWRLAKRWNRKTTENPPTSNTIKRKLMDIFQKKNSSFYKYKGSVHSTNFMN